MQTSGLFLFVCLFCFVLFCFVFGGEVGWWWWWLGSTRMVNGCLAAVQKTPLLLLLTVFRWMQACEPVI